MRTTALLSLVACLGFAVGCEVPEMEVGEPTPPPPPGSASKQDDGKLFSKADWYLPDGRVDMSGVEGEPPMTTGTPREITAKDPKKGKLTRRDGGALGTSLKAGVWAVNEMTFIAVKKHLAEYDALKGHYPRTHKEFMDDFLSMYPNVKLPNLEPGDAYLYDPDDHLLKIFRPGDPGAPQVEGVVAYEKKEEATTK